MKARFLLSTAICLAAATPAGAATAFLSPSGSGAICSSTAPCLSMSSAITAAGANGDVICLAPGNYTGFITLTITQSVTISCGDGMWHATGTALNINLPAGDRVVIEGYVSDGQNSFNGLNFAGQGELELHRSRISFSRDSGGGLDFAPNGNAELRIFDSTFVNSLSSGVVIRPQSGISVAIIRNSVLNGNGGSGVLVEPAPGSQAFVTLENISASANIDGVRALGSNSTVTIRDSALTNNSYGLVSTGKVDLTQSTVSLNSTGVFSTTTGVVTLSGSRIYGNGTGLNSSSGGQILTFGNNHVNGNTTDGAPTAAPIAPK